MNRRGFLLTVPLIGMPRKAFSFLWNNPLASDYVFRTGRLLGPEFITAMDAHMKALYRPEKLEPPKIYFGHKIVSICRQSGIITIETVMP